ncbi:hypothetical protein FRC18_006117 [Serendipita sp. 400]|nr:hypothetical protein FRC18_006117 [Serendipita sp. 400]
MKNKKQKQVLKRKRGQGRFVCNMEGCEKDFARADGLKRHQEGHSRQASTFGLRLLPGFHSDL